MPPDISISSNHDNVVVIINQEGNLKGTHVFGLVAQELRALLCGKDCNCLWNCHFSSNDKASTKAHLGNKPSKNELSFILACKVEIFKPSKIRMGVTTL